MPLTRPAQRLLSTAALAIIAAACAGPMPASVTPKPWDQAAVTALAKQLPGATAQLYQQIYDEAQEVSMPGTFSNSGQANQFLGDVRMMEEEAGHLATDLSKAKGKQQTIGSFQRIKELFDDAKVSGEQQFEVQQITSQFGQVESLIDQLEPYYLEAQ